MSSEMQPAIPKLCPECGGERMLYKVGPKIAVYTLTNKFDKKRQFRACICTTCGYTTFYLNDPGVPPIKKSSRQS